MGEKDTVNEWISQSAPAFYGALFGAMYGAMQGMK
jgi:hypothetical protein